VSKHDFESLQRIYNAISRWDVEELVTDLAHDIEWSQPDTLPWGSRLRAYFDTAPIMAALGEGGDVPSA
jgi:ketosteroid isomerase-like protein